MLRSFHERSPQVLFATSRFFATEFLFVVTDSFLSDGICACGTVSMSGILFIAGGIADSPDMKTWLKS